MGQAQASRRSLPGLWLEGVGQADAEDDAVAGAVEAEADRRLDGEVFGQQRGQAELETEQLAPPQFGGGMARMARGAPPPSSLFLQPYASHHRRLPTAHPPTQNDRAWRSRRVPRPRRSRRNSKKNFIHSAFAPCAAAAAHAKMPT